jgi:hypothetical protein
MEENSFEFKKVKWLCIYISIYLIQLLILISSSISPPSRAEVKNVWSYTSSPQYVFTMWCLVKQGDNFTFTFTLLRKL